MQRKNVIYSSWQLCQDFPCQSRFPVPTSSLSDVRNKVGFRDWLSS